MVAENHIRILSIEVKKPTPENRPNMAYYLPYLCQNTPQDNIAAYRVRDLMRPVAAIPLLAIGRNKPIGTLHGFYPSNSTIWKVIPDQLHLFMGQHVE